MRNAERKHEPEFIYPGGCPSVPRFRWVIVSSRTLAGFGGANVGYVKSTLEQNPDRFESRTGEAAKAVGRHRNATVWGLTRPSESHESDHHARVRVEHTLNQVWKAPTRRVRHEPSDRRRIARHPGSATHPDTPARARPQATRERRSVSRSPGRGVAGLLEAARPRADYLALLDESTHDGVTRVR
jgi:hypothetical protein